MLHPIFFKDKPDNHAKLWRYMNLARLIGMFETNAVHFTRIDRFNDHFEGFWPQKDLKILNKINGFNVPGFTYSIRPKIAVSCWHESPYESSAMWGLYNHNNEGVAIQTTFEKLETNFNNYFKENSKGFSLYGVARVKYIDSFNDGLIQENGFLPNTFSPFMLKHHSYEHEKEVRALIIADPNNEIFEDGYRVSMPTNELIEKIIINPHAPQWFSDTVQSLLRRYGFSGTLEASMLAKASFYAKVVKKEIA